LSPRVHVSIHDVAPPFRAEVELALAMAHAHGAKPALLVVPDYHFEAPLGRDASLCARLRELSGDGHEILLHGYSHEGARTRGLSSFFAQRVVSAGEAEMSALSPDEAHARLDAGERVLHEAGLHADGFVPPAWSMPGWLLPVLAARGCAYTEDHLHVYSPADGGRRASLVLNYASRSRARLASSVAFCRLAAPVSPLLPTRVAIHPGDMRHAILRRELGRLLARARGRFVSRGAELLDAPVAPARPPRSCA